MARTNIDIDTELAERVMDRYRLRTKTEAVALALRSLIDQPMTREEALAMEAGQRDRGDSAGHGGPLGPWKTTQAHA